MVGLTNGLNSAMNGLALENDGKVDLLKKSRNGLSFHDHDVQLKINGTGPRNQVNTADEVFGPRSTNTSDYEMLQQPLGTRRSLKVICIGAGLSAINFCYQARKHMKDVEVVCYEKNAAIGGTWHENKYPGCACDIPAHTYSFTWAPYTDWPQYYSSSDDIEKYINKVVSDHDLGGFFKTGHEIIEGRWDEESSHWKVKVKCNGDNDEIFEDWCDFLVNGSGMLNKYKWPSINGLNDFKGSLMHTAGWNHDVDFRGKKVALIGVGSSGVQVMPWLQKTAGHVTHFIRSPTWITPSFASQYAGPNGQNFDYTEDQMEAFRNDPVAHREYIRKVEYAMNERFRIVLKNSKEQNGAFKKFTQEMQDALSGRQDLIGMLVPTFEVGCRRLTPAPGFLNALRQPNVTALSTEITSIDATGLNLADGSKVEVDIIVAATGFDLSYVPRFPLYGKGGVSLAKAWSPRPQSYLSMLTPGFPNYFMVMGPGAPSAHGGLLPPIEMICEYALKMLHRLQHEPIRSMDVKAECVKELSQQGEQQLQTTAWSGRCSSSFKNGDINGNLDSLHPGGRMHFFAVLENPRWEDFNYDYANNRYAHFGNGLTLRETEGRDLTWYWAEGDRLKLQEY